MSFSLFTLVIDFINTKQFQVKTLSTYSSIVRQYILKFGFDVQNLSKFFKLANVSIECEHFCSQIYVNCTYKSSSKTR